MTLGLQSNRIFAGRVRCSGKGKVERTRLPGDWWNGFHPEVGVGTRATERGERSTGGRPTAGSPVLAPLAQALVRVDVGFAAGACMRHILEVVDEAGDQAAAQITPHEAAEETQHEVH